MILAAADNIYKINISWRCSQSLSRLLLSLLSEDRLRLPSDRERDLQTFIVRWLNILSLTSSSLWTCPWTCPWTWTSSSPCLRSCHGACPPCPCLSCPHPLSWACWVQPGGKVCWFLLREDKKEISYNRSFDSTSANNPPVTLIWEDTLRRSDLSNDWRSDGRHKCRWIEAIHRCPEQWVTACRLFTQPSPDEGRHFSVKSLNWWSQTTILGRF